MASEPLVDENQEANLFRIVHNQNGALFLAKSDCPPDKKWPLDARFVFEVTN